MGRLDSDLPLAIAPAMVAGKLEECFCATSIRSVEWCLSQRKADLTVRQPPTARALRPAHEKRRNFVFPEIVDGALTSHQLSELEDRTWTTKIKFAFWKLGWYLRQPNILFAIKTGGGAAILAAPAFIPSLRPFWLTWRGEWSLISCESRPSALSCLEAELGQCRRRHHGALSRSDKLSRGRKSAWDRSRSWSGCPLLCEDRFKVRSCFRIGSS